jgi:hypothetical protein
MNKLIVGTTLVVGLAIGCGEAASSEELGTSQQEELLPPGGSANHCPRLFHGVPGGSGGSGGSPSPQPLAILQNGRPLANGEVYSGTTDAMIQQATPTSNFGSEDYVQVKGGANRRHGLLRFDLRSIPELTTIQAACLTLSIPDPSTAAYPAYEVYGDWFESQVTWNLENTRSAWQVPGAWGANDSGSVVVASTTSNETGIVSIPLSTELVQQWVHFNGENHGIIFGNDHSYDGLSFDSASSAIAANRPILRIW